MLCNMERIVNLLLGNLCAVPTSILIRSMVRTLYCKKKILGLDAKKLHFFSMLSRTLAVLNTGAHMVSKDKYFHAPGKGFSKLKQASSC